MTWGRMAPQLRDARLGKVWLRRHAAKGAHFPREAKIATRLSLRQVMSVTLWLYTVRHVGIALRGPQLGPAPRGNRSAPCPAGARPCST